MAEESGAKWWIRFVVVPLLGGGVLLAVVSSLTQRGSPSAPAESSRAEDPMPPLRPTLAIPTQLPQPPAPDVKVVGHGDDGRAPKSWCLATKEQWSFGKKHFGKDDQSIRAAFTEGKCEAWGISID
jgi:hypothetical protein